ncbi:MAG TPA: TetR/AcrR family transcriptional regulator [Polyangiaceae bacterium]|nr:TetR/AcrR family transcriptional regulator [Polyangiaceae bacterium]
MSQRSDARRNREALLRAADKVFSADTVDAPLQRVAERAGVGRGTLYRHFPDRYALAAALYEERLSRYEDLVAERRAEPDVLLVLLTAVTQDQGRIPGLFRLIFSDEAGRGYLDTLWDRSIRLFAEPLRVSQAAGVVRTDLSVDDLLMVVGMVYGVVNSPAGLLGPASVRRALELVLHGLTP